MPKPIVPGFWNGGRLIRSKELFQVINILHKRMRNGENDIHERIACGEKLVDGRLNDLNQRLGALEHPAQNAVPDWTILVGRMEKLASIRRLRRGAFASGLYIGALAALLSVIAAFAYMGGKI